MSSNPNVVEHALLPPACLQLVLSSLAKNVEPIGILGPLGYRWLEPGAPFNLDNAWLLVVSPTPNEISGGPEDGQLMCPGFKLNIHEILKIFQDVEGLAWRSPSVYTGELDGPEICIRGRVLDQLVQVRIFSIPPEDEKPSLLINLANGECREKVY
jgi:hypothetical protein